MEKRRVLLHIGIHKTGTTSIQSYLADSAEILARHNLSYPSGILYDRAHHTIPWAISMRYQSNPIALHAIGGRDIVEELREIANQSETNIVISSENLCFCVDGDVQKLKEIFSGYDRSVIVYLRRRDRLVESEYVQRVDQEPTPERRNFPEFVAASKFILPQLDYPALIRRWRSFGNRVILRNFDEEVRHNRLVSGFLETLGVDEAVDEDRYKSNVRPSLRYVAMLRYLNCTTVGNLDLRRELRRHLLPYAVRTNNIKETLFSRDLRTSFLASFAAQDEKLYSLPEWHMSKCPRFDDDLALLDAMPISTSTSGECEFVFNLVQSHHSK